MRLVGHVIRDLVTSALHLVWFATLITLLSSLYQLRYKFSIISTSFFWKKSLICLNKLLQIEKKYLNISLENYLQIKVFSDWWYWSKNSELILYKKATERNCRKVVRQWPAEHRRPDFWDVKINFNLGQS